MGSGQLTKESVEIPENKGRHVKSGVGTAMKIVIRHLQREVKVEFWGLFLAEKLDGLKMSRIGPSLKGLIDLMLTAEFGDPAPRFRVIKNLKGS